MEPINPSSPSFMTVLDFAVSWMWRTFFVLALAMAIAGCGQKAPPSPPPPEVLVTDVKQQDVPIYNEYVGQLDGSVNATIQARVQGYLTSQNYKEGQLVKKGDVLFQIDPRPFEAALAQAKAAFLKPMHPPNRPN